MNKINIALMGAGFMGACHAERYAKIQNARLSAVIDTDRERASILAKSYGARTYNEPDELFDDPTIDVVDICLPTPLHKPYTLKAAESGKHVFCEKPIAGNMRDSKDMVNACRGAEVMFMVGHVVRFFPDYKKMKELVDKGEIGEPKMAHASRLSSPPKPSWYWDLGESGGVLLDMAIHDFDFLRWIFGEVKSLYTKRSYDLSGDMRDYGLTMLRFERGGMASVESSWAHPEGYPFTTRIEVAGTEGVLASDSSSTIPVKLHTGGRRDGPVLAPESPLTKDGWFLELEHFLHCVSTGEEPAITGNDALGALAISLAATESANYNEPKIPRW